MNEKNKVGHPVFIASVVLLILNDWYFKAQFHNAITGKLSDFAGLFALPFLLGALWPRRAKIIHLLTAVAFVAWKSPLSQPIIDAANGLGIPLYRVVDITDNTALISVLLSYILLRQNYSLNFKPLVVKTVVAVSCFAFMATVCRPGHEQRFVFNKEYRFPFPKSKLVAELNNLQIKEVRYYEKRKLQIDFNSETNTFHLHGEKDTIAILLDYKKLKDTDTIIYRSSLAEMMISGTDTNSVLKLVALRRFNFGRDITGEGTLKIFERKVVKKLQKSKIAPYSPVSLSGFAPDSFKRR